MFASGSVDGRVALEYFDQQEFARFRLPPPPPCLRLFLQLVVIVPVPLCRPRLWLLSSGVLVIEHLLAVPIVGLERAVQEMYL